MQAVSTIFTLKKTMTMPRMASILAFTCAAAIAAHIKIPVPGTVVPITMQTAIVLLAGLVLGSRDGVIAALLYVLGGASGLPFFAGASGMAALAGPTGGYLLGFIAGAWLAGKLKPQATTFVKTWMITLLASIPIFVLGAIQLKLVLDAATMSALSWGQVLALGVVPFIFGDLVKVTLSTTAYRLFWRSQKN